MLDDLFGAAAFVSIVIEQELRINYVQQLNVAAVQAQVKVQRVNGRFLVQFFAGDVFFRDRRGSQRDDQFEFAAVAQTAFVPA
jgi:hypothetical protein